jgi:hypothetical protein
MAKVIPFGRIRDVNIFPDGIYRLKIEKLEPRYTKERDGHAAKLMFAVSSRVVEPEAFKNMIFFENFVIGTEQDPEADELATWDTSVGGRQLKRLVQATGTPVGDEEDIETFGETMKGAEYLASIVQKVDDGSRDPKYKGTVRNVATRYWKLGATEPSVADAAPNGAAKPKATKAAAKAAPAATPTDTVTCTACRKRVPRAELPSHVASHMQEEEAEELEE